MPTQVDFMAELMTATTGAIAANAAAFAPALGFVGSAPAIPKIEFAREGDSAMFRGKTGLIRVWPVGVDEVAPEEVGETAMLLKVRVRVLLITQEARGQPRGFTRALAAMQATFADGGTQLFAALTDSGGNRLFKSGRVTIEGVVLEEAEELGPANTAWACDLLIEVWVPMPMVTTLPEED
jgi:hypothetical protein